MNSNLNSIVTFFGDFSIELMKRDTSSLPKGRDKLPGREIAQKLRRSLKNSGYTVGDICNNEPFYSFTIIVLKSEYTIDTMLLGYHNMPLPQWSVSCIQRFSLIEKLFGSKEKEGYRELLGRIHKILSRNGKVSDIKWYRDVNTELNSNSYATTPLPEPQPKR